MSTICHHTISLDGYIAGPDDAMDWAFAHGRPTAMADETMKRVGAIVAGGRWYELAQMRGDPELNAMARPPDARALLCSCIQGGGAGRNLRPRSTE